MSLKMAYPLYFKKSVKKDILYKIAENSVKKDIVNKIVEKQLVICHALSRVLLKEQIYCHNSLYYGETPRHYIFYEIG